MPKNKFQFSRFGICPMLAASSAGKKILVVMPLDPDLAELRVFRDFYAMVSILVIHVILRPFLRIRKGNVCRLL